MRRLLAVLFTLIAILAAGWLAMRRPDIPFATLEAAYASPQSAFLRLEESRQIHYRDEGARDAPAIVLVHGFSASLHTWADWVARLGDDYRVVSLDLPGHGLTRGFPLEAVDTDGFAAAIDAVTRELGIERFTLVGSSMGGHAAWRYALETPGRLDALVLVSAAGWPASPEESQERPAIFRLLDNGLMRTVVKDLDMTLSIRSGLEASFVNEDHVTDAMVERYVSLGRAPGHREAILHLLSNEGAGPAASKPALERLDLPVLVMHGREDAVVPVRHGRAFAEAIPGARLVTYDGVGHLPHEERPDRSAADLHAFLAGEPAAEPAPDRPASGAGSQP